MIPVTNPAPLRLRVRRPYAARACPARSLIWLLLVAGAVVILLPFVYMLASSLETNEQIGQLTPQFIPQPFEWGNYQTVWQHCRWAASSSTA